MDVKPEPQALRKLSVAIGIGRSFTPPNGYQLAVEEVAQSLWILPAVPRS